ncbi:Transcriptional regulator, AraC protein [Pseudomonas coronafaciens pv. garcae]|nr:Transcriptional regulator, AraC protein [Pseudomonas coronafaciens pv. garcae]
MRFVQRRIAGQTLWQVRVGNVRHAERYGIGLAFCQPRIGSVLGEFLVGDIHTAEGFFQLRAKAVFSIMLTGADERDTALAELFGHVAKSFGTAFIAHVMHVGARREMHADATSAPDFNDCISHFQQQTSAILHRAAVLICALIGPRQQELLKQVAVGTVDLDTIETRRFGVFCTDAIGLDDVADFRQLQCARYRQRSDRAHQAYMAFGSNGTWRNRSFAIQVRRVGNAAYVPQLQDDAAASVVYGFGDVAPAANLIVGPDAGGVRVTHAHRRYRGGFSQDQACRSALHVILGHHCIGHAAFVGAAACQGRHDDAVGQLQIANGDRVKDSRHVSNPRD